MIVDVGLAELVGDEPLLVAGRQDRCEDARVDRAVGADDRAAGRPRSSASDSTYVSTGFGALVEVGLLLAR